MLISVDPNSGVPVYRQIVDQVRFQIASGVLRPGDELPSTRTLSLRLGVNPMTVSKAWGILEADGIVGRRAGLTLVVNDISNETRAAARSDRLESALQPAILAAIQLGIPSQKAASLFRRLIDKRKKTEDVSE
jgi:GntR family transcriptional regulator